MTNYCTIIATQEDEGKRLLTCLKNHLPSFKREDIRFAITHHQCKLNGAIERFESKKMRVGDTIEILIDKKLKFEFEQERVLFEDPFICIYNKPVNCVVTESFFSLFPAHRLDRDTSGALLLIKERKYLPLFEKLFRMREIEKSYLALVSPPPSAEKGVIECPVAKIGNKEGIVKWGVRSNGIHAKTLWELKKKNDALALLKCTPITGRTHQIRVHLSHIGHPILGDVQYGSRKSPFLRPMLHSQKLSFIHPLTQKKISVEAPLPNDFLEALNLL